MTELTVRVYCDVWQDGTWVARSGPFEGHQAIAKALQQHRDSGRRWHDWRIDRGGPRSMFVARRQDVEHLLSGQSRRYH